MNWVNASSDLKPPSDVVVIGEMVVPSTGGYKSEKPIYASFTYDHLYKRWKLFGITDYAIEAMMDKRAVDVQRWVDPNESMHYVVSITGERMPTSMT